MAEETTPQTDPQQVQDPTPAPQQQAAPAAQTQQTDPQQQEGATVNRHKYVRETGRLQQQVDDLTEQNRKLAEENEGWKAVKDEFEAYKKSQEDEKTAKALKAAGCHDVKAASARLDEFDGDIEKLKEAAPYLFTSTDKSQSTGGTSKGAPAPEDERTKKMRQYMGLKD